MHADVIMIRHGETAWNRARRIQGRQDTALTKAARTELARISLPRRLGEPVWFTSPLKRAIESALLLGASNPVVEPRLVEMDFGAWEGKRLADLRRECPDAMVAAEGRGLDMRPPQGETPREVQARVRSWLAERGRAGDAVAAVTHKGVIRATLSLALDWDMRRRSPVRLDWKAAHVFRVDETGKPAPLCLNLPLDRK